MQQASYEFGFEAEDIPLMIEAIPVSADCIVLIVTKVDDPEELDTRFSKFSPSDPDDDYEDYDYPYEDYDSMETIDASAAHALPSANDELNESDTDADSIEDDVLNIFSKLNNYLNKGSASGSKGTGTVPVPAANKPESSADTQKVAPVIRCFSFENLDAFSEAAKAVLPVYNDKSHLFKHTNGRYYVFWKRPAVLLWTLTRPATFFPNTAKRISSGQQPFIFHGTHGFHYKKPCDTGYGKTLAFKYNVCRPPAYHLKSGGIYRLNVNPAAFILFMN